MTKPIIRYVPSKSEEVNTILILSQFGRLKAEGKVSKELYKRVMQGCEGYEETLKAINEEVEVVAVSRQ